MEPQPLTLHLTLDAEHSAKYQHYLLYRGVERGEGAARPVVDGFYVLREAVGDPPPARLRLTVEALPAEPIAEPDLAHGAAEVRA